MGNPTRYGVLTTIHLRRVQKRRIDLAVEVTSRTTERVDRVTKLATYARFGIRWYWIADLKRRWLEEHELVGKTDRNKVKTSFDNPFAPRIFPGLEIDLASLEW